MPAPGVNRWNWACPLYNGDRYVKHIPDGWNARKGKCHYPNKTILPVKPVYHACSRVNHFLNTSTSTQPAVIFSQNDCVCVAPMPCLTVSYLKKQGVSGKADGVSWVWACKWMERVKEVGKGEREERSRNLQR